MNAQIIFNRQSISPIIFRRAAMGCSTDIFVVKHKGRITLPRISTKSKTKFRPIIAPSAYNVGVLNWIDKDEPTIWGKQLAYPGGETAVMNYLVEFRLAKTKKKAMNQMEEIEQGLDEWFSLVRDWVAVLSHQDLSINEPLSGAQDDGNFLWSWQSKKKWRMATASTIHLTVRAPDFSRSLTLKQWRLAINQANRTIAPPEEHLILRDARARLWRNQYKYSAIFSGVAAEITLKKKLETELTGLKRSIHLINTVSNNTLGKLLIFCETLGIGMPTNVKDLNKIRNKAIHKSMVITKDEAKTCLEIADEIVKTYSLL